MPIHINQLSTCYGQKSDLVPDTWPHIALSALVINTSRRLKSANFLLKKRKRHAPIDTVIGSGVIDSLAIMARRQLH